MKVLRAARADGGGVAGTLLDSDGTVACGDGAVRLIELQAGRQGRQRGGTDFVRGARLTPGTRLGA